MHKHKRDYLHKFSSFASLLFFGAVVSGCMPQLQGKGITTKTESTITASPTPSPTIAALSATYTLSNDATSILLKSRLNRTGTVYYAIYNADQGVRTAAQVKAAAISAPAGALISVGTVTVSAANTDFTATIAALADKVLYTVYAVAEDTYGLDTDANVKKYAKVLAKRVSLQTYATAQTGLGAAVGATIRYNIYYPSGYYDNPTGTYPLLVYLGGAGELPNSAGNAETLFTAGHYRIDKTPYISNINGGIDYPFIVITGQCNRALFNCTNYVDTTWTHELITTVESTYRVNSKRIYLVGMSNGGGGVWNYIFAHPEKVAAAVPIAAPSATYTAGDAGTLCAASRIVPAVWHFHNSNDPLALPAWSATAVTNWNNCTGKLRDAKRTLMPGNVYPATLGGHNTVEYVVGARYIEYSPSPAVLDPDNLGPLPIEATAVTDLAAESVVLGTSVTTIEEWLLQFSQP
jgi:predicted peptidase